MQKLRVLDLFAGAGGFTIAGEMAGGFETVAFCEIDKHAQKVLRKNWPDVPIYEDVTKLNGADIGAVDVITGGFPCQDLSSAGRGAGIGEGTRSGLFREMLRIACEVRSISGQLPYIVFENVPRLLSGPSEAPGEWFSEFLWSLAEVGYDAEWFCITAASIGAPHERERVCVVAYPNEAGVWADFGKDGKQGWWSAENRGKSLRQDNGSAVPSKSVAATSHVAYADCGQQTMRREYEDLQEGCNGGVDVGGRCYCPTKREEPIRESRKTSRNVAHPHQTPIERGGISRRVYAQHADIDCKTIWWSEWGGGEPEICGVDDGISKGSYARRNGIMGNAIVPQVFAIVMKALREAHEEAQGGLK